MSRAHYAITDGGNGFVILVPPGAGQALAEFLSARDELDGTRVKADGVDADLLCVPKGSDPARRRYAIQLSLADLAADLAARHGFVEERCAYCRVLGPTFDDAGVPGEQVLEDPCLFCDGGLRVWSPKDGARTIYTYVALLRRFGVGESPR